MLKKAGLILVLFLVGLTHSRAQDTSGCLTQAQLLRLQYADLEDIRRFLNNEGWSLEGAELGQSLDYFERPLRFDAVRWDRGYFYNGGKIYLYSAPGLARVVVYQSNTSCFSVLRSGLSSSDAITSVENDLLKTQVTRNGITIEFRESTFGGPENRYIILVYNAESIAKALDKVKFQEAEAVRLANERRLEFETLVADAERLFDAKQFSLAKLKYELALQMEYDPKLTEKVNLCIRGLGTELVSNADALYEKQQYAAAISKYQEAITFASGYSFLSSQSDYARQQITAIREVQEILTTRKRKIFNYAETNASELDAFKGEVLKNLENQILAQPKGYLNASYRIAFDTLGYNNSQLSNITGSVKNYQERMDPMLKGTLLSPSRIGAYNVASESRFSIAAKWETDRISYSYGPKDKNASGILSPELSSARSYLQRNAMGYGNYILRVRDKEVNNRTYRDIELTNYRVVGPEAAFLSMLMPGMGTLKVTYGEKGWGRFAAFLVSTGLAVGAKMYSDQQYDKYKLATEQIEIDRLYNQANLSHQISLGAAGLAATIYVHDFFWVLSKGGKNKKEAKNLKKRLDATPISIQNQPIQLK